MGEVIQHRAKHATDQVESITVGEHGNAYLHIELDHRDQSVTIDSPANYGWFWLEREDDDIQSIDDVIKALELAKQHLAEFKAAEARYQ